MGDPNSEHDEYRIYFRDELRKARASALRDAESYHDLLYCFERLGSKVSRRILDMNGYSLKLKILADNSPLAEYLPDLFPQYHTSFADLYTSVRRARNEAMHQGAAARHLTTHAIELALILEDALVNHETTVDAYMVRNPVTAELWQPLSFLRQIMLSESFSYLPVFCGIEKGEPCPVDKHLIWPLTKGWYLISDYALASGVSKGIDEWIKPVKLATVGKKVDDPEKEYNRRKAILAMTLGHALGTGVVTPERARLVPSATTVAKVLRASKGSPVLIRRSGRRVTGLLGIVTPFGLL